MIRGLLRSTVLACLLIGSGRVIAEDPPAAPHIVPPPPPEALTRGESIEPDVTIVRRQWALFEEYSVNGRVYAVVVRPGVGPSYYLYDADGDGSLEMRHDLRRDVPQTPLWEILSW